MVHTSLFRLTSYRAAPAPASPGLPLEPPSNSCGSAQLKPALRGAAAAGTPCARRGAPGGTAHLAGWCRMPPAGAGPGAAQGRPLAWAPCAGASSASRRHAGCQTCSGHLRRRAWTGSLGLRGAKVSSSSRVCQRQCRCRMAGHGCARPSSAAHQGAPVTKACASGSVPKPLKMAPLTPSVCCLHSSQVLYTPAQRSLSPGATCLDVGMRAACACLSCARCAPRRSSSWRP